MRIAKFAFAAPLTLHARHLSSDVAKPTARLTIRSFAPRARRPRRVKQWVATEGSAPMRIAVVGGGLAGLGTTYHLLHSTRRMAKKRGADSEDIRVTVFDPAGAGVGGATAAAAGLLHPFSPRVKRKVWHGKKAVPAVSLLVDAAQAHADKPLMRVCGLMRPALDERAKEDYEIASNRYPFEVKYWDPATVAERCPQAAANGAPAVFLPHAAVIDVPRYAAALAKACDATGRMTWRSEAVTDVLPLLQSDFDAVIVANGAGIRNLPGLTGFPVTPCRGQNVRYAPMNDKAMQPAFPIISGKYIIPDVFGEGRGLLGGATFEYLDKSKSPVEDFIRSHVTDVRQAAGELDSHLKAMVPSLEYFWKPESAMSGIRALPPRSKLGTVPIAGRLQGVPGGKDVWVLTGLGSRGVLYHAYLGRCVAHAVVAGNEKLIPLDARQNVPKMEHA